VIQITGSSCGELSSNERLVLNLLPALPLCQSLNALIELRHFAIAL